MKNFSTKRLCRAGIIAALYVAFTYAFMPFAFGPFQIRPAEALCILPLFFVEAVPALYIGCMLANLFSGFGAYDIFIGSAVTLVAALCTFFIGKLIKKSLPKFLVCAIFPVLFNAVVIPFVILFFSTTGEIPSATLYFTYFFSLLLTQTVWIYGLGAPVYSFIDKMQKKGFTPLL